MNKIHMKCFVYIACIALCFGDILYAVKERGKSRNSQYHAAFKSAWQARELFGKAAMNKDGNKLADQYILEQNQNKIRALRYQIREYEKDIDSIDSACGTVLYKFVYDYKISKEEREFVKKYYRRENKIEEWWDFLEQNDSLALKTERQVAIRPIDLFFGLEACNLHGDKIIV